MRCQIVFFNERENSFSLRQKLSEEDIKIYEVHNEAQLLNHAEFSGIDAVMVMVQARQDSSRFHVKEWSTKYRCPLIALTSEKDLNFHKELLTSWADDVITLDPSLIMLKAKCEAFSRRKLKSPSLSTKININPELVLDLLTHDVIKNGKKLLIPKKEFQIIKLLAENPAKVFSKDEIYLAVWGSHDYDDANLLNVHIRRIRNRIEKDPNQPIILITRWGIGYQLIVS